MSEKEIFCGEVFLLSSVTSSGENSCAGFCRDKPLLGGEILDFAS